MIELQREEKIVYEIRRHWYVLVAESATLIIFLFLPWLVLVVLDLAGISIEGREGALFIFMTGGWLLLIWAAFAVVWTNYYLDVWLVTNMRIIDIEQHGLFSRDVSEFRLDRIQDVTVEVKGFLPTILHFGDIHVQTAGESREFVIRNIPRPYRVKEVVMRSYDPAIARAKTNAANSQ